MSSAAEAAGLGTAMCVAEVETARTAGWIVLLMAVALAAASTAGQILLGGGVDPLLALCALSKRVALIRKLADSANGRIGLPLDGVDGGDGRPDALDGVDGRIVPLDDGVDPLLALCALSKRAALIRKLADSANGRIGLPVPRGDGGDFVNGAMGRITLGISRDVGGDAPKLLC